MTGLINGRMPEHIKAGLRCRVIGDAKCSDCAYYGTVLYEIGQREYECDDIDRDALSLIERLEAERDTALAKVPKWISVEERLPEKEDTVLTYCEKEKFLGFGRFSANSLDTVDIYGHRVGKADYYMPLPEPPREE